MRRSSPEGFTLIELLVAATITLILAGLMLSVVTNILNLWQKTQNRFTASAQASLALDMIERDLQTALDRHDGGTWLAVDVGDNAAALVSHGWLTSGSMKRHLWFSVGALVAAEGLNWLPFRGATRRWARIVASLLGLASGFSLRWAMIYGGKEAANDPHTARLASRPDGPPGGNNR